MRVGKKCFGWCLWRGRSRRLELWACFEDVRPHRHPGQRVEVVPVLGWAEFCRLDPGKQAAEMLQTVRVRPGRWFRSFTIPAGWVHWFELRPRRGPLVFLNWTYGRMSPAQNFVTQ